MVFFSGMVAVSRRDIKKHQYRMLVASGLHVVALVIVWGLSYRDPSLYSGPFQGAYSLLFQMHIGLGLASLGLGGVTLWAVNEHAWELHRRTGMFTFFSASVCSVVSVIMLWMILAQ